jgi:hypothetical protein
MKSVEKGWDFYRNMQLTSRILFLKLMGVLKS